MTKIRLDMTDSQERSKQNTISNNAAFKSSKHLEYKTKCDIYHPNMYWVSWFYRLYFVYNADEETDVQNSEFDSSFKKKNQ